MLSIVTSIAVLLASFGAVAQIDGPDVTEDDWVETATVWLLEEIAAIEAVGGFVESPAADRVLALFPDPEEDDLGSIETMVDFDNDNADLLEVLETFDLELSPVVIGVFDLIPLVDLNRLAGGEQAVLDPEPWLVALTDVFLRDGSAPAGARQPGEIDMVISQIERLAATGASIEAIPATTAAAVATTVAPVVTAAPPASTATSTITPGVETTADASVAAESDASPQVDASPQAETSSPVLVLIIAAVALMAAIAVVALRRRPSRELGGAATMRVPTEPAPVAQPGYEDLLDLSRRMTTALDPTEVAQLAVDEAMRLAHADGAGFLVSEAAGLRFSSTTSGARWTAQSFARSRLSRVLETGQPMVATLESDPAIDQPSAVAAIPVIAAGGVVGVIAVVRPADAPFGRAELDALQPLGPMTGSAMFAANAHSSAVSQADIDGLTQLKNRRRLDRDLADVPRGQTIGFAMIDVDHFKNFNDTNGHQAGDVALQTVAQCLAANVRAQDVVYRYGGEEFSVVLLGATESEAMVVMERVRAAVESAHIPGGEHQPGGRVTISVGLVISVPVESETAALAGAADEALYRAKHDGRNRVVVAR